MSKKPTLDEMKAALGREDNLARFLHGTKVVDAGGKPMVV